MSKHTPGPWTFDRRNGETEAYEYYIIRDKHGLPIAETPTYKAEDFGEENENNAALIAAAPEMLQKLYTAKRMINTALSNTEDRYLAADYSEALMAIDQVIERAEGGRK